MSGSFLRIMDHVSSVRQEMQWPLLWLVPASWHWSCMSCHSVMTRRCSDFWSWVGTSLRFATAMWHIHAHTHTPNKEVSSFLIFDWSHFFRCEQDSVMLEESCQHATQANCLREEGGWRANGPCWRCFLESGNFGACSGAKEKTKVVAPTAKVSVGVSILRPVSQDLVDIVFDCEQVMVGPEHVMESIVLPGTCWTRSKHAIFH